MKKELASVKGEVELLRTMLDAAKQQLQEHRSAGSSGSSGYNTLGDDSQCGGAPVQQNEEGGHNHVMHDHVMSPMDSNDSVAPRPVRLLKFYFRTQQRETLLSSVSKFGLRYSM